VLDTARNFLPVSSIKKQIDVMETVKLNQFHWHITDSQSFPLALKTKGMDIIAKTGAYAPKAVYDQKTVQEIIQYAASRGVNVIPEIDMPGHMRAGIEHYGKDELITCNAEKPWINWANEPPSGHLDIRKPAATQFAKDLFSEMATFFPGQYFGTGNDEINPHCFGLAKDDKAGADKLLKPFVDSVHSHLVDLKKTPVVWEEAVVDFPETGKILKPDSYVEAWISNKSVTSILQARKDVNIILAQVDFFYLDCGLGGWLSNDANGQSWCTYVTWQKQYSFDPFAGSEEIDGAEDRIKGGESAAWSEQIDSGNLDSVVWPRAAAGAEVFWTGASFNLNGKDTKRDLLEAEPRMHDVRGRIRAMGVLATPLQPFW
jgi:hexosaminidase